MQYFQETCVEKLASRASKSTYTSVIIHHNGLSATVEHTATGVTWQENSEAIEIPFAFGTRVGPGKDI